MDKNLIALKEIKCKVVSALKDQLENKKLLYMMTPVNKYCEVKSIYDTINHIHITCFNPIDIFEVVKRLKKIINSISWDAYACNFISAILLEEFNNLGRLISKMLDVLSKIISVCRLYASTTSYTYEPISAMTYNGIIFNV